MTFKAYMQNIEAKTGKTQEDFWTIANEKGYIANGKIVAPHRQLLEWLKSDVGLGHVHANMVIVYFRLRTKDPKLSEKMKTWAYSTGYQDSE
jgi:hypothetical protein